MPQRHLIVISLTALISFACYEISFRQRVASVVGEVASLMNKEGLYHVDQKKLTASAVNGMIENIDSFSAYYAGEEAKSQKEYLQQEYKGVGINIRQEKKTGFVLVLRTIWGSPAMEAGVLSGDLIVAVDGQSFIPDDKMSDVFERLRGPVGSKVELTIRRKIHPEKNEDSTEKEASGDKIPISPQESEKTINIVVTRRAIQTRSVYGHRPLKKGEWEYLLPGTDKIAYLRIEKFGERTSLELREAIDSFKSEINGLVIDLRNNPGGYLEGAIQISDMFLEEEGLPIVMQKNRLRKTIGTAFTKQPAIVPDSLPIVILINESSASASEIVSACLQDHGRAVVVGQRSYGKGTVQSYYPLSLPGSFLKLTTASYWRPSGRNIHRMRMRNAKSQKEYEKREGNQDWGVKPDPGYSVPLSKVDSFELQAMRSNSEIGLSIDDVKPGLLKYIKETQAAREKAKVDELGRKLPAWEFTDKVQFKDGKTLFERDVQLQKALEVFKKKE